MLGMCLIGEIHLRKIVKVKGDMGFEELAEERFQPLSVLAEIAFPPRLAVGLQLDDVLVLVHVHFSILAISPVTVLNSPIY